MVMKSCIVFILLILLINVCCATIKKPEEKIKIVETYKPSSCPKKSKVGDTIQVHYTGKLVNGYKFDSSVGGSPFSFKLGSKQVIAGWEVGLLNMCIHSKRHLVIPPSLAYGSRDLGDIPPNSYLIFDVELISIK